MEMIGSGDADVIGYARDGDDAVAVLLRVRDGKVVGREHRFLENVEDEEDAAILSAFLVRYYVPVEARARRVVLPFPPADWTLLRELLPGTDWAVPQRGTMHRWLRAGGAERASPAGEPAHRVVRDRGAGGGPGVRAGPRPGPAAGAAKPRLRRHLPQRRDATRSDRWSGSRAGGRGRASIASSRSRAWGSRTTSRRSTRSSRGTSRAGATRRCRCRISS